jgi:hypothetical protein
MCSCIHVLHVSCQKNESVIVLLLVNNECVYSSLKSHSLMAWLWLFKNASQAKAIMKLSSWPGLAQPIWAQLGLACSLRLGQAQH